MKSNFDVTPKREKETSDVMNEFLAYLIRSQELKKELVSNNEYILWLENFTIANPSWSDDDWIYFPEKISKEDYKRVEELNCFFSGIMDYAERNFIPAHQDEFRTYIFIKFNNIGYKISETVGPEISTYCERITNISHDDNGFIDFSDIVNNKKQKNVDYINKQLKSMYKIIEELISMGVASETILTKVQNLLYENEEIVF